MAIQTKFTDNSKEVLQAFKSQIENGLEAVGITAERYAKNDCPVDTGRLRNSITFATSEFQSAGESYNPADSGLKATPEKNTLYLGTNVEYAPSVELLNRPHKVGKAHFLRDAAAQHGDEYKKIVETSLKS